MIEGKMQQEQFADRAANEACAIAINNAVANHHDGTHFRFTQAFDEILQQFDMVRIGRVLANTINRMNYDGRFSASNKEWAAQYAMLDEYSRYCVLNAHPVLLDRLVQHYRETVLEEREMPATKQEDRMSGSKRKKKVSTKGGPER